MPRCHSRSHRCRSDWARSAGVRRIGLEAAYRDGPFLVQAEYIRTEVERFGGARTVGFQGGYVQASLILNGKGRAYKLAPDYGATYAIFSGVQVAEADRVSRGGIGVFELGTRFSAIDLDDAGIRGGIERDVTVALQEWEPRIDVVSVRARPDPGDRTTLLVEITYVMRSTNSRLNLVYPFYLE